MRMWTSLWTSPLAKTPTDTINPIQTLRVGLIGWPQLSPALLRALMTIPAIELVGVSYLSDAALNGNVLNDTPLNCDPGGDHANQGTSHAHSNAYPTFANYADLLPHIDAVCLALPAWHPEISAIGLTCLKAGVSIMGKYPIRDTLETAEQLVQTANQHQCILQLGSIEPGYPALQALSQVLPTETVYAIETVHIAPCTCPIADISVVFDLLIHDIEYSLSVAQSSIVNIAATGIRCPRSGQLNYVTAILNFTNGCIATLTARHTSHYKRHQITTHCRDAHIQADLRTNQVLIHRQSPAAACKRTYQQDGWTERIATSNHDPLQHMMTQFFQYVRDDNPPLKSPDATLQSIRIATEIEAKAENVVQLHCSKIQPVSAAPTVINDRVING